MTWTAGVWKAPASLLLIESWPGWTYHRRKMMDLRGIRIGSTAHPESAKPRSLIQSVQTFTIEGSLRGHFSAGGMTPI